MFRLLMLFGCLCSFLMACQDKAQTIEEPEAPHHELRIDGSVQFRGEISRSISNDSLSTKIWVENVGEEQARFETGACAFNVIAYNKNAEPVWYNRMPDDYICFDEMLVYKVAPKEIKELTGQMYISGKNWHLDIPKGELDFKIKGRTMQGDSITFDAVRTKMN